MSGLKQGQKSSGHGPGEPGYRSSKTNLVNLLRCRLKRQTLSAKTLASYVRQWVIGMPLSGVTRPFQFSVVSHVTIE